jgi:hypothetical protein
MTQESLDLAMSAPIKPRELDEEIAASEWPLPEPRKWKPIRDESLMGRVARIMDATWGFMNWGKW